MHANNFFSEKEFYAFSYSNYKGKMHFSQDLYQVTLKVLFFRIMQKIENYSALLAFKLAII